jgi:hypothetical protein
VPALLVEVTRARDTAIDIVAVLAAETFAQEAVAAWDIESGGRERPGGEGGTGEGIESRGGERCGICLYLRGCRRLCLEDRPS